MNKVKIQHPGLPNLQERLPQREAGLPERQFQRLLRQ